MENPALWKQAEHVVNDVLQRYYELQASEEGLPPGFSMPAMITHALTEAGLFIEGASMFNSEEI